MMKLLKKLTPENAFFWLLLIALVAAIIKGLLFIEMVILLAMAIYVSAMLIANAILKSALGVVDLIEKLATIGGKQ